MPNYFKQFLLVSSLFTSAYAMKRDISSITYSQEATAKVLNILNTVLKYKYTLEKKDYDLIKKHIEQGADPNVKKTKNIESPLIQIAIRDREKDFFEFLLQHGADINASNILGTTPLHDVAGACKDSDIGIRYLLEHRANPNIKNNKGETPLLNAIIHKNDEAIQFLIQFNADINYKIPKSKSFLAQAIDFKNLSAIKTFCGAGASLTDVDNFENNAFHLLIDKPLEYIKTVIVHAHSKQHNQQEITKSIKTALLVFNRLNIHQDIQFLILSKLLSIDYFHKKLYNQLLKLDFKQFSLSLINNHIAYLQQTLKTKNAKHRTAHDVLLRKNLDPLYIVLIENLFNGDRLEKDLEVFNQNYLHISLIPEDNLALQIYNNHYNFKT